MRRYLLPLLALFMLTACQDAPIIPPEQVEPPRFTHLPPVGVNAGELRIASDYQPTFRAPHVDHLFQVTPADAMAVWAQDRLRVTGQGKGALEFVIVDASIIETPLEVKDGIKGIFTTEPSERYDAKLVATMKLYDGVQRMPAATAEVNLTMARSIQEGADVYAREEFFNSFLEDLMKTFNEQMQLEIDTYFRPHMVVMGN